jgi:UDP-N-acetylmuramate-alanine ligase
VLAYLTAELRPGDLCLTLGAGDLTSLPTEVQPALRTTAGVTA